MSEPDRWKTIYLPLDVWTNLIDLYARVLKANDLDPEALHSEDRTVRIAARVRATELLTVIGMHTPDEHLRSI